MGVRVVRFGVRVKAYIAWHDGAHKGIVYCEIVFHSACGDWPWPGDSARLSSTASKSSSRARITSTMPKASSRSPYSGPSRNWSGPRSSSAPCSCSLPPARRWPDLPQVRPAVVLPGALALSKSSRAEFVMPRFCLGSGRHRESRPVPAWQWSWTGVSW
jgi:hypothetical protein